MDSIQLKDISDILKNVGLPVVALYYLFKAFLLRVDKTDRMLDEYSKVMSEHSKNYQELSNEIKDIAGTIKDDMAMREKLMNRLIDAALAKAKE